MKILIVIKNWLGDVLFEEPAVAAIREAYPGAEIACLGPERCREMIENHPAVDRYIVFDERKEQRSLKHRIEFVLALRRGKWNKAFLFHRSRTRAFLLYLGGVRERFGFGGKSRMFLTHSVTEPLPSSGLHQVDYFLKLIDGAGLPLPEKPLYRFYYSSGDREHAEQVLREKDLKRFVCFHLGANWEPKRWPAAHFAELADRIHERWGYTVVLTGAKQDVELADEMKRQIKQATIVSLVGQTRIGELGAIFERARFVVSGDSGPMHIASGVGARVVALFGPTNPDLTGPRGVGDRILLTFVPEGYCTPWYGKPVQGWLAHIRPADVMKALEKEAWQSCALTAPKKLTQLNTTPLYILVVTLSNVGDVILTTPVITALADEFPGAKIRVVTGPRAVDLLAESRYIDRVFVYDKKADWKHKREFLKELRREYYDVVVDLRNTAIPYLVRAEKRSPVFRFFREKAMRDRHLELLKMMKYPHTGSRPFDFFREKDRQSAVQKLKAKGISPDRKWIAVSAAAASELKTWRLEGFRDVIQKLLQTTDRPILLVGDRREREMVAPLVTTTDPGRVFNLAGETTLKELAALIADAALLLTNDSAAMHLGYELDRPVVAVFGPTHPGKYGRTGPHFRIVREALDCSPCERPVCRFSRQACFEDLRPEKVFEACRELLASNGKPKNAPASEKKKTAEAHSIA